MAAVKARRAAKPDRRALFDAEESRVRERLERLSRKRDTEHRLNVREALRDREKTRAYAAGFGGASVGDGVRAPGVADGFHVFEDVGPGEETAEWGRLAGVNHVLNALAYADVTCSYAPTAEDVGARLILVRGGRAVGYAAVIDGDGDGEPDALLHVWVAGYHRRRGVGRDLVQAARERWPIVSVVGPLNTLRGASKFAATVAPDLPVVDYEHGQSVL